MTEDKTIINVGDGEVMLAHQDGDDSRPEKTKVPDNVEDIRKAGRSCATAWTNHHPGRKPKAEDAHLAHIQTLGIVKSGDPGQMAFVTAFMDTVKDLPENPRADFLNAEGETITQLEIPEFNASQTDDWVVAVGNGNPDMVRVTCVQIDQAWSRNSEGVFELEAP